MDQLSGIIIQTTVVGRVDNITISVHIIGRKEIVLFIQLGTVCDDYQLSGYVNNSATILAQMYCMKLLLNLLEAFITKPSHHQVLSTVTQLVAQIH